MRISDWIQTCALPIYLAVLDAIRLGAGEDELAARDVDLAAAEIDRVDAFVDRGDDLRRGPVAAQHVGIGHARHRRMGIGLAATIAGGLHPHEPGVHAVLHVARQDAVLDQRSEEHTSELQSLMRISYAVSCLT